MNTQMTVMDARRRPQGGFVIVMVAASLVAIMGIAGLALDLGHAYVNKTRLQNAVDAAALSGAKVLDVTKNTAAADTGARTTFTEDIGAPGNRDRELISALSSANLVLEFSPTLIPWSPGGANPKYVRASVNSYILNAWFIRVLGITTKTVAASAVAGPSPVLGEVCNIAPVLACGNSAAGGPLWGYTQGQLVTLKTGSGNKGWAVGPGNYQLIQLGCGPGGACVRQNMAGSYENCIDLTDSVQTKPGNTVGPTAQGINTRFGSCSAGLDCTNLYKPDWVIDAGPAGYPDTYAQYQANYAALGSSIESDPARSYRRVLTIPIGNCTGTVNGQGTVPLLGFGCFFLTQPVAQGGQQEIYGEFIDSCDAAGTPGPDPGAGPGPYLIQLYKDPIRDDT